MAGSRRGCRLPIRLSKRDRADRCTLKAASLTGVERRAVELDTIASVLPDDDFIDLKRPKPRTNLAALK